MSFTALREGEEGQRGWSVGDRGQGQGTGRGRTLCVVEDLVLSSKELADVMQFLGGWEIFEKSGNSDPYILPAKIFKVVGDWLSDARGAMVT